MALTPERKMWISVLNTAGQDAIINKNDGSQRDAEFHYNWSKSRFCRDVCGYANLDWDCVKAKFKAVYDIVLEAGDDYKCKEHMPNKTGVRLGSFVRKAGYEEGNGCEY